MKKLIILIVLLFSGCNTLKQALGLKANRFNSSQDATNADFDGIVSSDNETVLNRIPGPLVAVSVFRENIGEWYLLNKYEYKVLPNGNIRFGHETTILPSGQITFSYPEIPVAPKGTKYKIRQRDEIVGTDFEIY